MTNSRQLTFSGKKSGEGYFSADGKKMIYQSDRDVKNPFYQMYIMDLASGKSNLISTGSGKTTCGWVHPNLKTVMWSSTHLDPKFHDKAHEEFESMKNPVKGKYSWSFDEQFDIFSSDLNGKNLKRLTKELGYDAEGSYSPDGKHIAFASNRQAYEPKFVSEMTEEQKKIMKQDTSYFMDIYIMDADGKNVKQLTNTPGYDGGPFFSADGKKITWRRFNPEGTKAEIYTMNIDGTDQKAITKLNVMSWAPFFHPSGQYVIFTTSVNGMANFELYIVDSDGKKDPIRVTNLDGFDGLPTFSPDGNTLSWTRRNEKGESQIYLADWNHEAAMNALGLVSQNVQSLSQLSPELRESDVKNIVQYMASEEFKGRATGSPEEKIYSKKIAELFKNWGLKTEIQKFDFISGAELNDLKTKASFKGNFNKDLKLGTDVQIHSYSASGHFEAKPIVFAGYGIYAPAHEGFSGYNSYKNLDVKNKWVIIIEGQPTPEKRDLKTHAVLVPFSGLQHKITVAKNNGAYGVILVSYLDASLKFKYDGVLAQAELPVLKISNDMFLELFSYANQKTYKNTKDLVDAFNSYEPKEGFEINSQYLASDVELKTTKSEAYNVVGILYPKNKTALKNAILIGAHGDHLGLGLTGNSLATGSDKGQIHYGADDNASGVSGVLELAHYYSKNNKGIKNPLIFAIWSGEEVGILGSNYFTNNFKKIYKSEFSSSVKAALNMDMIGRLNPDTKMLFVQGVGSSKAWPEITEQVLMANQKNQYPVAISLGSDPYLPTDSMSFYMAGVPSISFFTGGHTEYHTPKDKPETLNYPGLLGTIETVKNYVNLIDQTAKIPYEKVESQNKNLEGRSFRLFLGTIPDYTQEGVKGVKVSGVSKNSPAEKSGIKTGDVIIEFDKVPIANIYDYVYTLQTVKPNIKTQIKVMRDQKAMELDITPALKE